MAKKDVVDKMEDFRSICSNLHCFIDKTEVQELQTALFSKAVETFAEVAPFMMVMIVTVSISCYFAHIQDTTYLHQYK